MEDYTFSYQNLNKLCALACGSNCDEFRAIVDAVSDEDRSRFGPTTFCPPPSTDLPSPLVTAAGYNNLEVLCYLLETFPNIIDINTNGQVMMSAKLVVPPLTAATLSAKENTLPTISYLIKKGASVNQMSMEGESPLMIVASRNPPTDSNATRIMKYLIDNGADVNKVNYKGETLVFGQHTQFALVAGVNKCHRNYEGHTALHVAAMFEEKQAVTTLLDLGLSPFSLSANDSTHPNYVPCPLYVAAAKDNEIMTNFFLEKDGCPPVCEANAFLLLGAAKLAYSLQLSQSDKVHKLITQGLKHLDQHNIKLSYPPPQPEYNYQVEIKTTEELDAVWDTDDFMRTGLIYQCALIVERCLGCHSLLYAKVLMDLGLKLINNEHYIEAERLWELSIKTLTTYNSHICSQQDYCYGNYFVYEALEKISRFLNGAKSMVNHNHTPNFLTYINYGLHCLECMQLLSNKATSSNIYININYQHLLNRILRLFMWWSICKCTRESFLLHLNSFIKSYLHCPKKSTILHLAVNAIDCVHSAKEQTTEFIEAVLEAGGGDVINYTSDKGQRLLHIVANNEGLTELLIKHGAHVDAVDSKGKTAFPTGTFGVPPLYCTVANAIVRYSLPYQWIGLPPHVVQFVMLHDSLYGIQT